MVLLTDERGVTFVGYNALARQLNEQLNQKKALIRFNVLDGVEYLLAGHPSPFGGKAPPP